MRLLGRVLAPDDLGLCTVVVAGGRIADIVSADADAEHDAGGPDCLIVPGLIDIQLNGAFGIDFGDPSADLAGAAVALPGTGVTAFLPTIVTAPTEHMTACLRNLASPVPERAARPLGVHVEGPFLSPARVGAHDPDHVRPPSVTEALAWLAAGPVRMVTLAPERAGASQVIRALTSRGVLVAMGHSEATWQEADAAIDEGVRLGTHLFNAMRAFHHREPGIAGRLLGGGVAVSVIVDGVHVAPSAVRLVAAIKDADELILVTDGLAALGRPAGRHRLGGREVLSDGTVARLRDGTLAGSTVPMATALGRLVRAGLDATLAVRGASTNPARLLGADADHGRVAVGRVADLVVLDSDWRPLLTLVAGKVAYPERPEDRRAVLGGRSTSRPGRHAATG